MYAPLPETQSTVNLTIEELNVEEVKTLIPTIIYTSLLMICGVIGNAVVLYVYCYRFKASNHRYFILTLGVCDFITSAICMPFLIVDELRPFTFNNVAVCKSLRYVTYNTAIVSIFTLFVIAIERYRKICRPFKSQITLPLARRILSIIVVLTATVFALPSVILYGHSTVKTGRGNTTGVACFIDDRFQDTHLPVAYNSTLLVIVFSLGAFMVYCYSKIAYQRLLRAKARRRRRTYRGVDISDNFISSDQNGSSALVGLKEEYASEAKKRNMSNYSEMLKHLCCELDLISPDITDSNQSTPENKKSAAVEQEVDKCRRKTQHNISHDIDLQRKGFPRDMFYTTKCLSANDVHDITRLTSYAGIHSDTRHAISCDTLCLTEPQTSGQNGPTSICDNIKFSESETKANTDEKKDRMKQGSRNDPAGENSNEQSVTGNYDPVKPSIAKENFQTDKPNGLHKLGANGVVSTNVTYKEPDTSTVISNLHGSFKVNNSLHRSRKTPQTHRKKMFIKRSFTKSAKFAEHRDASIIKVTKMLFVITLVYFLSFIPHLVLMNVLLLDDQFLASLGSIDTVLYYIALRSFLINSVANPFVYNFMDRKFRKECKKLWSREKVT